MVVDTNNISVRLFILEKYDRKCAYCGDLLNIHSLCIDHINPVLRSKYTPLDPNFIKGTNEIDNLNPSCLRCNSSKSCKSLEDWRKTIYKSLKRVLIIFPRFRLLVKLGLITVTNAPVIFHFEKLKDAS